MGPQPQPIAGCLLAPLLLLLLLIAAAAAGRSAHRRCLDLDCQGQE
jgi:hypothetical protein